VNSHRVAPCKDLGLWELNADATALAGLPTMGNYGKRTVNGLRKALFWQDFSEDSDA